MGFLSLPDSLFMLIRRCGTAVRVWAPAKINLHLEVLGRRPDGYHELATLMVAVSLHDTLEFTDDPAGAVRLRCETESLRFFHPRGDLFRVGGLQPERATEKQFALFERCMAVVPLHFAARHCDDHDRSRRRWDWGGTGIPRAIGHVFRPAGVAVVSDPPG